MTDTLLLRYRPLTVEARQLTEDNRIALAHWVDGWTYSVGSIRWPGPPGSNPRWAQLGDWIVRTPWDEFEVVTDEAELFSKFDRVVSAVTE